MEREWGKRVQIVGTDILGQILKIPHGAAHHGTECSAAEKGLKGIQDVKLLTQALGRAKEIFQGYVTSRD